MINSQFNSDVNFTKGQIDIKELNAFMNDKKKKIEKELTKYDVDKDTQFKAQNLQHLTSMAQYMPLFTKKIKDPKAIKKQKATREMDYTHKTGAAMVSSKGGAGVPQVISPRGAEVPNPAPQTERVIRDPGPRIVNKDQYEEIQQMKVTKQQNATVSNQINKDEKLAKKKDKSPSPLRKVNEDILIPLIDRDTLSFNRQLEEKRLELEALTFKHAKAQAKFLQIMRELSKFRDEFNEQYSIRSKMLKVKEVTTQIDELLQVKEQMLANDETILTKFTSSEHFLLDPKSPQLTSRRYNLNENGSAKMERNQLKAMNEIGAQLAAVCVFSKPQTPENDTKIISISNIPCIVTCKINKQKAVCNTTIRTQVSHQDFSHEFNQLTEKFNPWEEVKHLRFIVVKGNLKLEYIKNLEDKYISVNGGIYAMQDKKIIVYVYGAPQRFFSLNLLPVTGAQKKMMKITLLDPEYNSKYCQIEVTEDRLFRDLLPQGYQNSKGYEIEIKALIYKYDAVRGMISKYIKQQLQAVKIGQDISEALLLQNNKISAEKFLIEIIPPDAVPTHQIAIIDREAYSIKARQSDFPGLKVSQSLLQQLNPVQGNTIISPSKGQKKFNSIQRKESSCNNGTSVLRSYLGVSNELMHQAVFEALNKKREFAQSEARGGIAGKSNTVSPSETPIKTFSKIVMPQKVEPQKNPSGTKNTKMQQIMKLIQANSMYMQIHGELYIHDKEDFAAFLELVHNTDDDSLLLFIVDDPKDCHVKEVRLNTDLAENDDWLLIEQRFGKNVEQLLCNVETIFRSTEFFNIVKHLIQISRLERNYYNQIYQNQFAMDEENSISRKKESTSQIEQSQAAIVPPKKLRSGQNLREKNKSSQN